MNIIANFKEDHNSDVLVEGLFNTKTVSMLYADEKIGKTLVTLYLCGILTCSNKLFNRFNIVKNNIKILYFSGELLSQLLIDRINYFKNNYNLNFNNVNFILGKNNNINIFNFFNDFITDDYDFIIVDSLAYYFDEYDFSDKEGASKIINYFENKAIKHNCHILLVNHVKKSSGDYIGNRLVGSRVINIFKLTYYDRKRKILKFFLEKTNYNTSLVVYIDKRNGFKILDGKINVKNERIKKLYEILEYYKEIEYKRLQQLTNIPDRTLRRYIDEMYEKGNVDKIKKGKNIYVKLLWIPMEV